MKSAKRLKIFLKANFMSIRRKPKCTSAYANLEQRLADDICELVSCLDTEIAVTPEIRCMFKSVVRWFHWS